MIGTTYVVLDDIGDVPHIRGERELEVPLSDMVADILSAVVRYGEGFDGEARQREGLTDGYISSEGAYRVLDEATMRYAVVHQTSGIDRQVVDSADDTYGAYMVGMIVGDDRPVEVTSVQGDPLSLECLSDGAYGDPSVNEEAPVFVSQIVAVPTASAGETHEPDHLYL